MSEVSRIEAEILKKEELFNNHGHEKGFFQAPHLHTHIRKKIRVLNGSKEDVLQDEETEEDRLKREQ